MGPCAGCRGWRRGIDYSKLGVCKRCIRIAVLGTAVGWLLVAVATWWDAPSSLVALSVLAAGEFALVLLLHVVALAIRVVARRRPEREQRRASPT
jgi:hypothetical protein